MSRGKTQRLTLMPAKAPACTLSVSVCACGGHIAIAHVHYGRTSQMLTPVFNEIALVCEGGA